MSTSGTQRRSHRQNPCAYMLLDETCKKKTPPPPATLVKPDSDGSVASMEEGKVMILVPICGREHCGSIKARGQRARSRWGGSWSNYRRIRIFETWRSALRQVKILTQAQKDRNKRANSFRYQECFSGTNSRHFDTAPRRTGIRQK